MVSFWNLPPALNALILLAAAAVLVILATRLFTALIGLIGRGRDWTDVLRRRTRVPFAVLSAVVLSWVALGLTLPVGATTSGWFHHLFLVLLILSATWALGSALIFVTDLGLAQYAVDGSDGWQARRARTQVAVVRRLIGAATVIVGIAAALLTIPGIAAVGGTLLASAGFLSVVAGLAAQSTLSNVFAGMQLAFSGAIRLQDIVVVNGEWGYIDEITLTYVVVKVWDERRLVLPSTYFTQQPYENWTRESTAVLGTVFFDLDWGVDILRMRAQLDRILAESGMWDGAASSLRITDTVGGYVQVRALISAADAFTMFDLSRTVREEMLLWLQRENPEGLPRTRIQAVERDGEAFPKPRQRRASHPASSQPAPATNAAADAADEPSRGDETRPISTVPDPEPEAVAEDGAPDQNS
ncbi:mechanosensitive ion channel family protein [Microbacterium sp. ARD32]|uniref:mechanosensitive ion channel family protein n=1 Tax=Microbacterium sp. ARD32 TaxID=2962577 RepID=UPI002881E136|nr:mechanosensitive ion channel family protein [Microbacterium sp. ARD32]MDT0158426.1 mechanosensitive ion channel family protein [Microbacterium sp. ARD32]